MLPPPRGIVVDVAIAQTSPSEFASELLLINLRTWRQPRTTTSPSWNSGERRYGREQLGEERTVSISIFNPCVLTSPETNINNCLGELQIAHPTANSPLRRKRREPPPAATVLMSSCGDCRVTPPVTVSKTCSKVPA